MVIRGQCDINKLNYIYETINRIIDNECCYYSDDEVEELKKDTKNIFLSKS